MAAEWAGGEWEDALGNAIKEIVSAIAPMETEWDEEKLEKKIRDYFRKAAKANEKWKKWDQQVADYCDTAFSSLFCSLGDREWLAQADFLLAVDAGLKETIPKKVLSKVPKEEFEKGVLMAYEKAWEYQRFSPIVWEATKEFVTGPKTCSKVRSSFEEGREEAAAGAVEGEGVDAWVERWVDTSVRKLAEQTKGYPADTLDIDTCNNFVQKIIDASGLPPSIMAEGPPDMTVTQMSVSTAYEKYTVKEGEEDSNPFADFGKKKATKAAKADAWGAYSGTGSGYGQAAAHPAYGGYGGGMKGGGKGGMMNAFAAMMGKGGGKGWGPY